MKIKDYPIIIILIFFLTGFIIGFFVKISLVYYLLSLIILIFLAFYFNRKNQAITNVITVIIIIILGAYIFSNHYYENESEIKVLDQLINQKVLIYGEVAKVDYLDNDKIQYDIAVDTVVYKNFRFRVKQNFQVNLDIRGSSFHLKYFENIIAPGNKIRVSGKLVKPAKPLYIGDFNYQLYLKSKDINYILRSNNFDELNLIKENTSVFNYRRYLSQLRQKIKFQIEKNFNFLEAAYIKGLFIAERRDIPEDIKADFIASGVIHVLAVSGLHTGYIALILYALFGRFNIFVKFVFVVVGLFVFVHIANLSPSVIRASIMSVIVLLSLLIQRSNFLLNSISIAALLILMFNPLDIFNPGFQLSFSAVLSIALIYPVFNEQIKKYKIPVLVRYFVDLILISFSVSIGTFPLVVSYYQKFSFISILANLIVIPLTGLIIGGIILCLIVINIIPGFFPIYKAAMETLIHFNFDVVKFFGNLPFAYTSVKDFSVINLAIYFLAVLAVLIIIKSRSNFVFKFVSISLIVFNYIFHFNLMNVDVINKNKDYVLLGKLRNSNMIFFSSGEMNFLKFIEGRDSLTLLIKDLNKLDKIFNNLDYKKIKIASFSSHSIWLNNDLRNRIENLQVARLDDKLWLYGGRPNISDKYSLTCDNIHYKFLDNASTEIVKIKDINIVITPLKFENIKPKLMLDNLKVIVIPFRLDTIYIKLNHNGFMTVALNFEEQKMKIFEIKPAVLEEIKWK